MTIGTVLALIGVTLAVFALGVLSVLGWRHSKGKGDSAVLHRQINIGLSVFFTLVALMVVVDVIALTIKFNNYVSETLPRDLAQEKCNTETLGVLKRWVQVRSQRDEAADARDDAAVAILDQVLAGQEPTPEQAQAWRDAIARQSKVRHQAAEALVPLPEC